MYVAGATIFYLGNGGCTTVVRIQVYAGEDDWFDGIGGNRGICVSLFSLSDALRILCWRATQLLFSRATTVNRTHGTPKNVYIYLF